MIFIDKGPKSPVRVQRVARLGDIVNTFGRLLPSGVRGPRLGCQPCTWGPVVLTPRSKDGSPSLLTAGATGTDCAIGNIGMTVLDTSFGEGVKVCSRVASLFS